MHYWIVNRAGEVATQDGRWLLPPLAPGDYRYLLTFADPHTARMYCRETRLSGEPVAMPEGPNHAA